MSNIKQHPFKAALRERNKRAVKPFAVIDIETDPFKYGTFPEPFAACFYYPPYDDKPGETSIYYGSDCIPKLIERCKKWKGIIYAHNGGKFDFHFLLEHLPVSHCDSLCIGSRIVRMKFAGGYEFRDSFSLIPLPLSAWGKTDIDIKKLTRHRREKNKAEIIAYLKDDCKYLHEMLTVFFEKWGQKLTIASTTFSVLKERFGFKIPSLPDTDDARFRSHYFAGRVQFNALGRHDGNFTMLDINSAFPWAMTKPHWFGKKYEKIRGKPPANLFDQSFIICECVGGGALAFRDTDKSVCFPKIGLHRFFTTGWELKAGIKAKAVKNLKYIYSFVPRRTTDFTSFVEFFYKMKADAKAAGDKASEFHAKLFLNSCYGRFALNIDKYRIESVLIKY